LRSTHGINAHLASDETIKTIARKTGNGEEDVQKLFMIIKTIQDKNQISETELKELNKRLDQFKH
jgi:ABC-type taurine transport system substrate-binding protein